MISYIRQSLQRKVSLLLVTVAGTASVVGFALAYFSAEEALERAVASPAEQAVSEAAQRVHRHVQELIAEWSTAAATPEAMAWIGSMSAADDIESPPAAPDNLLPWLSSLAGLGRRAHAVLADVNGRLLWEPATWPQRLRPPVVDQLARLARRLTMQPVHDTTVFPLALPSDDVIGLVVPWYAANRDRSRLAVVLSPTTRLAGDEPLSQRTWLLLRAGVDLPDPETTEDPTPLPMWARVWRRNVVASGVFPLAGWTMVDDEQMSRPVGVAFVQVRSLTTTGDPSLPPQAWYAVVPVDLEGYLVARDLAFWQACATAVVLLVIVYTVGNLLGRHITEPVRLLRDEVRALAAGDFSVRVEVPTRDELWELAVDINALAKRLSDTYQTLEESVAQAEQRSKQLEIITQITTAMTSALTTDQTFGKFAARLRQLGPFGHCGLSLLRPDGSLAHYVSPKFPIQDRPFLDDEIHEALEQDRPWHFGGTGFRERCLTRLSAGTIFPLSTRKEVIGTLNLASADATLFSPEMAGNLNFMAEALAAAIQHNRLYEQVRGFAESLERQVAERTRELRQTHEQLVVMEKFAATGKLAANLAHEINNPLGIIKNYLALLKDTFKPTVVLGMPGAETSTAARVTPRDKDPRTMTALIQEEIDRIARLVRNLMNFYRGTAQDMRSVSLREELETIISLMKESLQRKNIELKLAVQDEPPGTWLSPDQVRQVFMNILRNAEDAIDDVHGEISVTMRRKARSATDPPNVQGWIEVAVTDTGKGIAPENRDKIFDPFFTTKGKEKGTGLGLSVTYGIMTGCQGSIVVDSQPGHGATFTLTFPIRPKPDPVPPTLTAEQSLTQSLRDAIMTVTPPSSHPRDLP